MSRDKKILLGCIAVVALLCLCACCGVGLTGFGVMGAAMGPAIEGAQIGERTSDHEACVEAALLRSDACTNMDVSCGFDVGAFEGGCLQAVRADPTAFCQNTPGPLTAAGDAAGRVFCEAHGRPANFGCGAVYGGKADFCAPYQR